MADPDLSDSLRAMNAALRSGDIAAIAALAPGIALTLDQIAARLPPRLGDLQSLRDLARENQMLLDAVGRGLRGAANRLADISQARRGLRTYGPGGTSRAWVDQTGQGKRF